MIFFLKHFRWLLLCFKREFPFQEGLTIFEIVCSQHLELSSVDVERIRDEERAKDFQRAGKNSFDKNIYRPYS